MIRMADIDDGAMYLVRKHETGSFGRLDDRSCTNCFVHYIPTALHTLKKRTIVKQYCEQDVENM